MPGSPPAVDGPAHHQPIRLNTINVGVPRYLGSMRWFARPENNAQELRCSPRLACWESADHKDQSKMREYLDDTEVLVSDSRIDGPWALRLDVGSLTTRDLLDAADLDNYAYPLAYRLRNLELVSVWCTKQHNERSFVRIDTARELPAPLTKLLIVRTTVSASTVAFKEQIRSAVAEEAQLPHGPVRLELSFVVGPRRNWLNLWKQTIDSLDPLLGRTYPDRPWHPRDGRITELGMHLTIDPAAGNEIVVGINAEPGRMRVSPYGRFDLNDKVMIDQPGSRDHRRVAGVVGLGPGGSPSILEIGQHIFGAPSSSKLTIVDSRIPAGVVITDLVGHAAPCHDADGRCDVILARGHMTPDDHELRSFRCDGSIDPSVPEPASQEANPMSNVQVTVRAAARANGWQVLRANNEKDIYVLPGEPDKRMIRVYWAASGDVLMASGGGDSISRYDDPSTKKDRVLSALANLIDVFPPAPTEAPEARREVEPCGKCFLVHSGECPEPEGGSPQAGHTDCAGAQVFRDDDRGYSDWLSAHPGGYVVNIARSYNADAARVHRAGCRTISGQNPHHGPWTGPYVKVCASQLADLQLWAADAVRDSILPCGICRPTTAL